MATIEICGCVTATGALEQMVANPYCHACGGTGHVTQRSLVEGLDRLNNDIDQLASTAIDLREQCPEAKTLLDLAWWFTEQAIRRLTGRCSMRCTAGKAGAFCACCNHFEELKGKAAQVARIL